MNQLEEISKQIEETNNQIRMLRTLMREKEEELLALKTEQFKLNKPEYAKQRIPEDQIYRKFIEPGDKSIQFMKRFEEGDENGNPYSRLYLGTDNLTLTSYISCYLIIARRRDIHAIGYPKDRITLSELRGDLTGDSCVWRCVNSMLNIMYKRIKPPKSANGKVIYFPEPFGLTARNADHWENNSYYIIGFQILLPTG